MLASSPSYFSKAPRWSTRPRDCRLRSHFDKIIIFVLVGIFLWSWTSFLRDGSPLPSLRRHPESAVYNDTLGFEKVYVMSLPGREDRLQPMLDAANATNITLTTLGAIRDDQLARNDRPKGWDDDNHDLGALGCLTSHVRTWQLMLVQNVSTALILESDADWDMRLKDSMAHVAQGARQIADFPFDQDLNQADPKVDPYGDGWDLLWIGHCGSRGAGNSFRQYAWVDPSTPPANEEFKVGGSVEGVAHEYGTRIVYQISGSLCTTGYAISAKGARKFVEYFKEGDSNVDLKLSDLCWDKPDLRCLGAYPAVISNAESTSNINHPETEDVDDWVKMVDQAGAGQAVRTPGHGIQFSARVNAPVVLDHNAGMTEWKYTFDGKWVTHNETNEYVHFLKNETAGPIPTG